MSSDEFRSAGRDTVDFLAGYLDGFRTDAPESRPGPTVAPGEVYASLPPSPPMEGEPFEAILADVEGLIVPGLTNWQHPGFYGFFPADSSPPSVLGELVSAGLGQQGMLWSTSPACTELEMLVLDWLAEAAGLPDKFRSGGPGGGVIQDSASCLLYTSPSPRA